MTLLQRILLVAAAVAAGNLVATWVFAGTSGTYNSQGAAGAQLTIGTSATLVVPFKAGRTDVYIFNGATNILYCEAGPNGGGAPSPSPTSAGANAFPINPSTPFHASLNGSFTPTGIGLIAQSEIDCACSAASCTVNTWELP